MRRKPKPMSLAKGFGTGEEKKMWDISNSPERIRLMPKVVERKSPPEKRRTLTNTGTKCRSIQAFFKPGTYI